MGAKSVIFNLIANDKVTEGVKKASKSLDQLNDKVNHQLGTAAKGAAAAGGAAAGLAFVSGLTGMIQLDNARGKLEAQLGLTKAQSKNVGDTAGRLFADAYGESMEEVNTAVTSVIQNMDGMRDASSAALQQTTARAMDVATVMDEEVGSVTRAVAQMMKTGLAKNAQEAFDVITAGTQKGANKAQDLLDTFNEYGTQFRKLGLDGKAAMGIIQQGLAGGARDADLVADSLKEISIRAIDGSATTIAGFQALGLNADQMGARFGKGGSSAAGALDQVLDRLRGIKDPVKQAQAATALFGTQAEDLGKALYGIDPSRASTALGNLKGAADRAGASLGQTTQAKFTAFKRTLQQDVTTAVVGTIGWFTKHETAAKSLAGTAGVLVTAWAAYNVVAGVMAARTALMTAGTVANTVVTGIASVATGLWAATTWALNAALAVLTSPITAVVVAIGLIIAAIVLAYKKNETFRNLVNAVWAGIKSAISAAWNAVKPIFEGIKNFLGKVLPIAMTVLKNVIKIAWIGIQLYIKVAWTLIKGYFTLIKFYVTNVLAPIFRWLWSGVIKPVWSGISGAIKMAWNNTIKPVFNAVKGAVHLVASAFRVAVSAIKAHWDKIKAIAKAPVNFVIGVYNRGIVDLVNKVAGFAGIKTRLGYIKTLAAGGTLANPAGVRPMMTNGPMAIVGEGRQQYPEFVIPTDPRHRARAQALWASAGHALAGGRWMSGPDRLGGEGIGLAGGGIIGGFMKGLKNFTFGNVEKVFKSVLGKVMGTVPGSGVSRDVVAGIPAWIKDKLLGWFKSKVGMGGAGGPGMKRAMSWVKGQNGKPYVWGGVGPGGYDCSGLMSAITNVIHGKNPYSRLFATGSFGGSGGPGGFVRNLKSGFRVGVTNAGVGHMAGTLLGMNVESSGSRGVHMGGGARGANDPLFGYQYGLKADTGALALRPGWNPPTYNGTGRKEVLTTPRPREPVRIEFVGRQGDALFTLFKEHVRVKGRGDVQLTFGSS